MLTASDTRGVARQKSCVACAVLPVISLSKRLALYSLANMRSRDFLFSRSSSIFCCSSAIRNLAVLELVFALSWLTGVSARMTWSHTDDMGSPGITGGARCTE